MTKTSADTGDRDIRRGTRGAYWEYCELMLNETDDVRRTHTNEPIRLRGHSSVHAKRRTRKNGKVLGPWHFIVNGYRCYLNGESQ